MLEGRDTGASSRSKAFVIPHLDVRVTEQPSPRSGLSALGLGDFVREGCFLLVHSGTLLRARDPRPLLRAFHRLVTSSPVDHTGDRLLLLGGVDRSHASHPEWRPLERSGHLLRVERRVDYGTTLAIASRATANVVLEAPDPVSPFFPAKLVDCLAARLPILALTPPRSVVRELLGGDYPLLRTPDDEDGVLEALETLWGAWRRERLDELTPPESARAAVAEGPFRATLDEVLRHVTGT
jgi:hypothetical protein